MKISHLDPHLKMAIISLYQWYYWKYLAKSGSNKQNKTSDKQRIYEAAAYRREENNGGGDAARARNTTRVLRARARTALRCAARTRRARTLLRAPHARAAGYGGQAIMAWRQQRRHQWIEHDVFVAWQRRSSAADIGAGHGVIGQASLSTAAS